MAQQAHHIIPVAVFNNIAAANLDINFGTLFGEIDGRNFQQMGSNFIYLYEEANYAQRTASLLQNSPNIYGDLSIGGAQHSGSHNDYNDFIETRLEQIFDSNLNFTSEERKMMVLDLQRGLKEILIDGNPDVMNAANFDEQRMNIALDNKGVLSPLTFSTTSDIYKNAEKMLDDFNNGRAFTQVFDAGTRSTDAFAVHNAKMIYENTKELNEITSFLTEKSLEHFKDNAITSPKHARNVILSATYDTEKYLSSIADVEKITGKSLDKFTSEFKETVSLSFTHNLDAAGQTKLSNLKDSLKVQALDAKAVKLMADLRTDKKVFLDFNGVDDAKFQGSSLWDVLDHIGNSNEFDDVELNGTKISKWKELASSEILDADKKPLQKIDFKQLIFTSAVYNTNLLKAQYSEFDRTQFQELEEHIKVDKDKNLILDKNQHDKLINDTNNLLDLYHQDVGGVDKQIALQYMQKVSNEYIKSTNIDDNSPNKTNGKLSVGTKVGAGILLLSVSLVAKAANELPTEEEQKQFLVDTFWTTVIEEVASEAAEFAAKRLIATVVGAGFVTVSAPVAAVATLVAGIVAGMYGEDIYELTKDLDNNGRMDFVDRMSTLMFGQEIKPNQIPEVLSRQLDNNFETKKVDLNAEMTVQELVAKAKEDIAYRYALQELNPFVIEGANYDVLNEDGSLNVLDEQNPQQNPQGMSEQYLTDRATMLLLQLKYLQNGLKLGRDLDSYGIKGDWDYLDYGKHPFAGEPDSPLVFSIDGNGVSTDDHIIAFGTKGNDTFEGSDEDDRLYGGAGDDTFESSKGNDYMEGGVGTDIYHIKGNDTIFDSDMNLQIIFDGSNKNPRLFQKTGKNSWAALDEEGKLSHITATRKDNDLLVNNSDNSVTIKDFFLMSKNIDNVLWSGFGFNLIESTIHHIYESDGKAINNFQIRADNHKSIAVIGNLRGDTVMPFTAKSVVVDAGDGQDIIYGSGQGGNVILGGNDNDILHGANYSIRSKEKDVATDVIVGGAGNDLIDGMGGKDIIHAGEIDEHLDKSSNYEKGDWVNGHLGDDDIYGSRGHDLLQGGSGSDTVHGGAGNDVILGDGDVIFDSKWKIVGATSSSIAITPSVTPVTSPTLTGIVPPMTTGFEVTEIAGSRLGLEHDVQASGAISTKYVERVRFHDDEMHQWEIKTSSDDYEVVHKLIRSKTHLVPENGQNDELHGGADNDFIVGQTGDDKLYGDDGHDTLWGDDNRDESIVGNDELYGGTGNDTLHGGDGDDLLAGGSGKNKLNGGNGFDTYHIVSHETQHNIIKDSDNEGKIEVDGIVLGTLTWELNPKTEMWSAYGSPVTLKYDQESEELRIFRESDEIAFVENFKNGALGIKFENQAPKVANEVNPKNAKANEAFKQNLGHDLFQDEDDNLNYVVTLADDSPLPNWLEFDANAMTLSGTPTKDDAGSLKLKITATDKEGLSSHQIWSFQVELPPNEAPTLTAPQTISEIKENEQFTLVYSNYFNDDGGFDKLKFDLSMADGSALPNWLNTQDDRATLTPNFDAAGTYQLNVTAQDEEGLTTSLQWQINVNNANRAPVVSGSLNTQTLRVGDNWKLALPTLFSDADKDDKLSYRLEMFDGSSIPAWLKFDSDSQTLSGNPTATGNINLKLIATDSYNESVSAPINLLINPELPKPTVPTIPTVQEGIKKTGSSGNDTLTGTVLNDVLDGSFGNDQLYGLNGDDTLKGGAGRDTLRGDNGNDTLDGGFDNDILYGGAGNDVLLGGFADDVLFGGQGNDKLNGGIGNDTYIFNLGDGQDTIQDQLGKDTLKINGLKLSDVLFMQEGRNLVIDSKISDDSVTIENYYFYPKNVLNLLKPSRPTELGDKIETIEFADGQSLDYAQVDRMVQALEQLNSHSTY